LVGEAWQWATSDAGWKAIWQFLKDMAAILGVALAFLKWWENREAYIFGRLGAVLGEQASQTRDAVQYVIQRIRRPGPADSPRFPVFAEGSLRRLFSRRHWKPVFALADPLTSADRKLRRLHRRLEKRQGAATNYVSFVNEQRFAAHLLQGAIALGRAERASDVRVNRLIQSACDRFQSALQVPGKGNDLDALELKGLLLRKLGLVDADGVGGAHEVFQELQAAALAQLETVPVGDTERRRDLSAAILRAARYRAEMLHSQSPPTGIGLGILNGVEHLAANGDLVTGQRLLDRARYFEVNSCVRVALNKAAGAGNGQQTLQRIDDARRNYQTLRDDCDPKNWDWPARIWRICARIFREDGASELLREAKAGLSRLERIEKMSGCPLCDHHALYHVDADRTATPAQ
jgi:hypothetical protein